MTQDKYPKHPHYDIILLYITTPSKYTVHMRVPGVPGWMPVSHPDWRANVTWRLVEHNGDEFISDTGDEFISEKVTNKEDV